MSLVDADNDGVIDAKEFNAYFSFCTQVKANSGGDDNIRE